VGTENNRQPYIKIVWIQTCILRYLLHGAGYLFEKLTVAQLVKQPAFFTEPEGSLSWSQNPPLDPILSLPNPVHPIGTNLLKVHLNVILPPTPTSSQSTLAFGVPYQNPVNISPLTHACHMSSPQPHW